MVLLFSFFLTILDGFMIIIVIILNMVLCNTALTPLLRMTVDICLFICLLTRNIYGHGHPMTDAVISVKQHTHAGAKIQRHNKTNMYRTHV